MISQSTQLILIKEEKKVKRLGFKITRVKVEPENGKIYGAEIAGIRKDGRKVHAYVSFLLPLPYPTTRKRIFNCRWEDVEVQG